MVIQGMFTKTVISATQEKEECQPRSPTWQRPWEREACLRTEWDSRGLAGPAQLPRVDTVAQGTGLWLGNAGTMSSALVYAFHILCYSFLFLLP